MILLRTLVGYGLLLTLQGPPENAPLPTSDFPPSDSNALALQRRGLEHKLMLRQLELAPDSPETVALLFQHERFDDALRIAQRIVETRPERMVQTLKIVVRHWSLQNPEAQGIIAAARTRLASLPREDAARVARLLLYSNSPRDPAGDKLARLTKLIQEYEGTQEAQLAKISVIALNPDIVKQVEELDAFARRHPGTVEAASALHYKGSLLRSDLREPAGGDPTERFMRVLDVVNELESGRYPPCEAVETAPSLVFEFFAHDPKYSPENLDRMIEAHTRFVKGHFSLLDRDPGGSGVGNLITSRMAELFRHKGEPIAGVERTLLQLERDIPDMAAVRYLTALFYMNGLRGRPPADRAELLKKAETTLVTLSRDTSGRYQSKALATLASLHFREGDHATAIGGFRAYIDAYPRGDWAWVAALRLGQSQEALNDLEAAAASYRTAASRYASVPPARVFGHAYAASAFEALGRFDQALIEYQAALDGWDDDYGREYLSYLSRARSETPPVADDVTEIFKADLPDRIAQLRRSNALPGGALVERGRWLLARDRVVDAQAVLQDLSRRYPRSAAVRDGRPLLHTARLLSALRLADAANPGADETKAVEELVRLEREPYTFGVCAAKIARATILWKRGAATEARALMTAALKEWQARQDAASGPALTSIEKDIAGIRNLAFRPKGDGIYTGADWNIRFPDASQPFLIVNRSMHVKHADGTVQRVPLRRAAAESGRAVLLLTADQQTLFGRIITHLDETGTRPAAPDVMAFWNEFFGTRPARWGRWIFSSYPFITEIEFFDSARTEAAARITVGSSGTSVIAEKKNGTWEAVGLGRFWVE